MGGHTDKDGSVVEEAGQDGEGAMSGAALDDELQAPRPRRRFQRARRATAEELGAGETLQLLHAELVLLREENARLKAAQHQPADISRLLGRARSLSSSAAVDRDGLSDETAQMLVDGLVIRESLLEICQEIERSMVAFEAKLNALAIAAAGHTLPPSMGGALRSSTDHTHGNGSIGG